MLRGVLFLTLAVALLGGLLAAPASGQTGPSIELTVGTETVLEEGGAPVQFSYTARNNAYRIAILVKPRGGSTITDVSVYEQATAPTGLSTGTTYTFEVRRVNDYDANNAEDLGPAGSVEATPTAGGVAPPSGLAAEAGNGQVWLTWTDPQDATIVGYDYQQWQTGGRWSAWTAMDWTVVPRIYQSATRYRVMGLDNDVAYRFRVRARTGAGATSLPAGVAATPVAVVPAQPTGLTARPGLGVVVLTWADPGDASIQRYEYRQQTGTGPAGVWVNLPADSSGSARTIRHEVTGLASGTPYTFRVRAVNAAGASPASAAVTVTPRHRPPAPPANVAVTPVRNRQGQSVDVYWADPGDPTITRTEYSLDHGRTWQPLTPNTEFTGPRGEDRGIVRLGLTANLDYTLRVRFVNAAGPGEPSEPVRFYNGWRGVLPPSPNQRPPTYPNTAIRIITGGQIGDLGSHPRNDHGRAEFDRRTGTLTLRWMPGADTGKGPEVMYWRVRFTDELGLADPDPAPVPPTDVTLPLGVTSYTVRLPDPAVVPAGARGSIDVDVCVRATDLCYVFVHGDYQIPGLPEEEEDPYPGPTNVRVVEGDGQITVTWDPPVRGTASITKYQYNVIVAGADQWMDVPDGPDADTEASNERTVTVTGLTNGGGMRPGRSGQYPYFCHLRAVRVVEGRTEEGEAVQCGEKQLLYPRAAGIPQRPAGLTLWASGRTGGELLLTWADPGDGTLTGYEYRGSALVPSAADWTPLPNSDARTTQARFPFTVGSGHHGPPTGIALELRAVNAHGAGTDDGLQMPFTQFQAPARPTGLTATPAGPGQVTLRWTAPPPTVRTRTLKVVEAAFLGPLITDHRYTTDGGTTWHEIPASATGEAHATTYTVAGLPNGQAVTFHLLASNDEGASPVSEPVTATPQAVVPQAPTGVQATTAATAVTLTWAAPGDASLTGYEVQQGSGAWSPVPDGPDEDTTAGNERAQTVTGLTTGTAYTFRVRARNAVGVSPASAAVTATPGLPNAPAGVRALPGDAAVTLTWADPGDASVTGYEVQPGDGAWTPVEGSDATTVTEAVSGLTNGVAYTFRVRARTDVGPGPAAAAVTATPVHPNAPQVPRGFRANPLPGRVTLTWLEPENGNHPVVRYDYRQSADAGGTWAPDWTPVPQSGLAADGTPEANRLSYTLPGLANGQAVRVQLRGQNAHGAGPAAQATATPSADAGQVVITSEEFQVFETGTRRELTTPAGQTYTLIIRHDVPADQRWRVTVPGTVDLDGATLVVAPLLAPRYIAPPPPVVKRFQFAGAREDGLDFTITPPPAAPVDLCLSAERLREELRVADNPAPAPLQVLHYTDEAWQELEAESTEQDGLVCATSATLSSFAVGLVLVNHGPQVQTEFPEQKIVAGQTATLALAPYFLDPDGQPLSYTAASTDEAIVTATIKEGDLTLTGVAAGETTVTVTARDEVGQTVSQPVAVTVTPALDEARARARMRQLNREILSKQALVLSDQTNRAISARVASLGQAAPAPAQYRLGGRGSVTESLRGILGSVAGVGAGAGQGPAGRASAGATRLGLTGLTDWSDRTGTDRLRAGQAGADRTSSGALPELNLRTALGQSSFLLPLRNAGGSLNRLTLWGRGDYTRLDGDVAQHLEWDGDLLNTQVGADLRLTPTLLAGLGLTWADGGYDYTARYPDKTVRGTYDAHQMSLHPYVGWRLPDAGVGLWSTVGVGWGSVEVKDGEVGRQTSDLATLNAAVGGDVRLLARAGLLGEGTTTLTAKSDVAFVQAKVADGSAYMEDLTIQAGRGRLLLEGVYEETLPSGHTVRPFAEVGLRYDVGDTTAGVGVELGGGVRYAVPALGLTVEGRGRGLVGHGDYREYGMSGLVEVVPGAGGTGLAVRLTPTYGQAASGVQRLWTTPSSTLGPHTPGAGAPGAVGQMDAEVGYGVGLERGVLTPYGAAQVGGGAPRYRVGSRWVLPSGLHLTLEGRHQPATGRHPADQGLRLQSEWRF